MAETIDSLLIRLGLDVEAKGFKEANNQFSGLRTKALALGTTAIGVGAGLTKMSDGVARSTDTMGKWADSLGVGIRKAQQLKFALGQAGSANPDSDMMSMFENVDSLRTQAMRGELSEWALIESGMNLHSLMGMNNEEGLDYLMREVSAIADPERQRRAVSELGFSGTGQYGVMTDYDRTMSDYRRSDELGNADEDLYQQSAEYTAAMGELSKSLNSFREMVATQMLPGMTEWAKGATAWMVILNKDDASFLEKADEIAQSAGAENALDLYLKNNPFTALPMQAFGKADEYIKENTGTSWSERWQQIRERRGGIKYEPPSRSPRAGKSGLSPGEMDYEPSASELIPQGSNADLMEGNRRLLPSYVPSLSRPTASSSTTMNINVDARGSTDPMLTSERVRGVIRDEVGRMVDISRDGIPTNVA